MSSNEICQVQSVQAVKADQQNAAGGEVLGFLRIYTGGLKNQQQTKRREQRQACCSNFHGGPFQL
jgi:hypothetical protein